MCLVRRGAASCAGAAASPQLCELTMWGSKRFDSSALNIVASHGSAALELDATVMVLV